MSLLYPAEQRISDEFVKLHWQKFGMHADAIDATDISISLACMSRKHPGMHAYHGAVHDGDIMTDMP